MGMVENLALYTVYGMTAVFVFTITDAFLTGLIGDRLSKGSTNGSVTGA
jgi:hypothetical protein